MKKTKRLKVKGLTLDRAKRKQVCVCVFVCVNAFGQAEDIHSAVLCECIFVCHVSTKLEKVHTKQTKAAREKVREKEREREGGRNRERARERTLRWEHYVCFENVRGMRESERDLVRVIIFPTACDKRS